MESNSQLCGLFMPMLPIKAEVSIVTHLTCNNQVDIVNPDQQKLDPIQADSSVISCDC